MTPVLTTANTRHSKSRRQQKVTDFSLRVDARRKQRSHSVRQPVKAGLDLYFFAVGQGQFPLTPEWLPTPESFVTEYCYYSL